VKERFITARYIRLDLRNANKESTLNPLIRFHWLLTVITREIDYHELWLNVTDKTEYKLLVDTLYYWVSSHIQ